MKKLVQRADLIHVAETTFKGERENNLLSLQLHFDNLIMGEVRVAERQTEITRVCLPHYTSRMCFKSLHHADCLLLMQRDYIIGRYLWKVRRREIKTIV
jgi:hypothetical protein